MNMQKKVTGTQAAVILIIAVIVILLAGAMKYKDPPRITPEQTRQMMQNAPKVLQSGGPPNAASTPGKGQPPKR